MYVNNCTTPKIDGLCSENQIVARESISLKDERYDTVFSTANKINVVRSISRNSSKQTKSKVRLSFRSISNYSFGMDE